MFPDIAITNTFSMGKGKARYLIIYGIFQHGNRNRKV